MTVLAATALACLLSTGLLILLAPASAARLRTLLGTGPTRTRPPAEPQGEEAVSAAIGVIDRAAHMLEVGMTPAAVMRHLHHGLPPGRTAAGIALIARSIELGEVPAAAISKHLDSFTPEVARIFTGMSAVWQVSESSGAPAAGLLLRYTATCRAELDAAREREAALAGPRATVRVLMWLPLIGMGLGLLIGVDPVALLATPVGVASLVGGVVLLLGGRWWMRLLLGRIR